jgi:hypothetical protein
MGRRFGDAAVLTSDHRGFRAEFRQVEDSVSAVEFRAERQVTVR